MTPRIGQGTPQQIQRPMGNQPFRPGQWNGVKVGGNNTTYIQNNFYGSEANRGWGDAWATYSEPAPESDSGKPGVLGWIGAGIGAVGAIASGIKEIIGNKKSKAEAKKPDEEQGGPPLQQKQQDNTVTPTQTDPVQKTEPEKETPEPEANPVDNYDWNTAFNTDCRDVDNNGKSKTKDIKGSVKVKTQSDPKKAPEEFTITTAAGNEYSFEKIVSDDGKTIQYKCTQCKTQNGTTTEFQKGNIYNCEIENGIPVLRQHEGMKGSGVAVGKE